MTTTTPRPSPPPRFPVLGLAIERFRAWLWQVDRIESRPTLPRRTLQTVDLAVQGFVRHRCNRMATALTMITLLSIVPILALAFTMSKGFAAQIRPWLESELAGSEGLRKALDWILDTATATNVTALGGAGVLLLLFLVLRTIGTIEESFNEIWGIARNRSWLRRLTDYLTLVVIGPLFVFGIAGLTRFEYGRAESASVYVPGIGRVDGTQMIGLAIVWAVFTLLYLMLPNARVRLRAALLGGIFGGSAWKLALWGYIELQIGVGQNAAIYGAFASVPIFIMWVFASWVMVLAGAELAAAVENRGRHRERILADRVPHHDRAGLALRLACEAARRLDRDEPPATVTELADRFTAPVELVRELADRLEEHEIFSVTRTSTSPRGSNSRRASDTRVVLARRPDHIDALAILEPLDPRMAGRDRERTGPKTGTGVPIENSVDDPVEALLSEAREAERRAIGKLTVADLVRAAHGRPEPRKTETLEETSEEPGNLPPGLPNANGSNRRAGKEPLEGRAPGKERTAEGP